MPGCVAEMCPSLSLLRLALAMLPLRADTAIPHLPGKRHGEVFGRRLCSLQIIIVLNNQRRLSAKAMKSLKY
jgi:hypothetical protein